MTFTSQRKRSGDFVAYVDLRYQPSEKDVVCKFYLEPRYGTAFEVAASAVAAESSIGTWIDVETSKTYIKRLAARVFHMNPIDGIIDIAYPIEAFGGWKKNLRGTVEGYAMKVE